MPLEPILSEAQIYEALDRIAADIKRDFGDEPILLVGVLKGSMYCLADLSRRLGQNIEIDFVQVSSWHGGRSSSGIVQIRKDLDISIEGRNVVVIEDIIDSGLTIKHLRELFATRKPKCLKVAALLSKPEARVVDPQVEYIGFEIPNEFVVGYGLDDKERYRNLPYIAILRDDETPS
jgi:hypoxanthine phosphoribosyltransferase